MKALTRFLLPTLGLLLLAGCASPVESRIKSNAATFYALDPQTREKIRQQIVEIGYTPDMVYIAMGAPTERREQITEKGSTIVWSYKTTSMEYQGTSVRHRRSVVIDPRTGRSYMVMQPVVTDHYEENVDESLRIEFKDGRVSSIERNQ